jgi:hypothetical protein
LSQIDSDQPERSLFLKKASDSHAGVGKTLAGSGVGASRMLRSLELWTEAVAHQRNSESSEPIETHSASRGKSRFENSLKQSEDDFVREILEQNRTDAFDPARFNQPPSPPQ